VPGADLGRRRLVGTLTRHERNFAAAIGRVAEEEVKAGRMTTAEATRAVHHTFLRLLGLNGTQPGADGLHH